MSRTTAPLLSFDARGQIAKTQVYSSWKGRSYVRRYVIPSNPKTNDQMETRNTFAWLNNVWKFMPSTAVDAWNLYAQNSRFTARNGFIKQNLAPLRTEADLTNFVSSPSAGGGLTAAGMSIAPGAGQLAVTLTAPTLPTGWSIVTSTAIAILDQDPQSGTNYQVYVATDNTAPYVPTITGLTAAALYHVGGWFTFLKSDGSNAYGQAIEDTGTPS